MDGMYCIIATQSLEIAGMTLESKVRKGVQLNCIALLSVLAQPFVASWCGGLWVPGSRSRGPVPQPRGRPRGPRGAPALAGPGLK